MHLQASLRAVSAHLESNSGTALLDSLHGVLHLMKAALWTPCDHVRIILHQRQPLLAALCFTLVVRASSFGASVLADL